MVTQKTLSPFHNSHLDEEQDGARVKVLLIVSQTVTLPQVYLGLDSYTAPPPGQKEEVLWTFRLCGDCIPVCVCAELPSLTL